MPWGRKQTNADIKKSSIKDYSLSKTIHVASSVLSSLWKIKLKSILIKSAGKEYKLIISWLTDEGIEFNSVKSLFNSPRRF